MNLFICKYKYCSFTEFVALQHLVKLLLADGQPLSIRAVHHQYNKLKKKIEYLLFQRLHIILLNL